MIGFPGVGVSVGFGDGFPGVGSGGDAPILAEISVKSKEVYQKPSKLLIN